MRKKYGTYVWNAGFLLLYGGLGAMCYRLYLRQAIFYPGKLGRYDSDLPVHISEGVNGTAYSLMERLFGFLRGTFHLNQKPIAAVLALVTLGVIYAIWCVMCDLFPAGKPEILHLLAFACMFVMPLYLPELNAFHYLGKQSGTVWHNSTYMGMKFAGTLVMLLYYRYQEQYRSGLTMGRWLLFTASLILVNLMKPNFILCFAPAMALMLLGDCICDRGKTFGNQVLFGIPVLISLAVVVREGSVLFGGENSGASIILALPYGLLHWNRHPAASLLQSAAFPLAVLAGSWRELKENRAWRASWLIWLTGLLEYLCLSEDGPRRTHGNLSWGYSYGMFLIFAVCVCRLYRQINDIRMEYRTSGEKCWWSYMRAGGFKRIGTVLYLLALCGLFVWHLLSGLSFSYMMYLGGSYLEGGI